MIAISIARPRSEKKSNHDSRRSDVAVIVELSMRAREHRVSLCGQRGYSLGESQTCPRRTENATSRREASQPRRRTAGALFRSRSSLLYHDLAEERRRP